jgi:hypothetical protein
LKTAAPTNDRASEETSRRRPAPERLGGFRPTYPPQRDALRRDVPPVVAFRGLCACPPIRAFGRWRVAGWERLYIEPPDLWVEAARSARRGGGARDDEWLPPGEAVAPAGGNRFSCQRAGNASAWRARRSIQFRAGRMPALPAILWGAAGRESLIAKRWGAQGAPIVWNYGAAGLRDGRLRWLRAFRQLPSRARHPEPSWPRSASVERHRQLVRRMPQVCYDVNRSF